MTFQVFLLYFRQQNIKAKLSFNSYLHKTLGQAALFWGSQVLTRFSSLMCSEYFSQAGYSFGPIHLH